MQDALAILLTLFAAAYLVRSAWKRFAGRQDGACGSCSNCDCDTTNPPQAQPLVQIEGHTDNTTRINRS